MKWLKRYSFLVMILVTGIGYGGVKVVKEVEAWQGQQEQEALERQQELEEAEQETQEEAGEQQEIEEVVNQQVEEEVEGTLTQPEAEPEAIPEPEKKEFRRVELDYLEDALFIGDSRTSTLYEYAGWQQTDFFVKNGLSIWEVWDKTMDGVTLHEKLSARQYGKIYIMLGVNELGNGTAESFREEFAGVVEQIRRMQPEAIIFVEAIIHVTANKDAEGTYINNQEIDIRNQELFKLTDNESVFWLDANEVMDEPGTGALNPEYTFDGVHLKVKNLDVWQEFLLEHGI